MRRTFPSGTQKFLLLLFYMSVCVCVELLLKGKRVRKPKEGEREKLIAEERDPVTRDENWKGANFNPSLARPPSGSSQLSHTSSHRPDQIHWFCIWFSPSLHTRIAYERTNQNVVEPDELKDDQWLGVSVASQGPGGYVVVIWYFHSHASQMSSIFGCLSISLFLLVPLLLFLLAHFPFFLSSRASCHFINCA